MGVNTATLKLTSTSDISAITRDLKNLGTEAKTAGAPFQTLSKNMDDTAKKAQTFSQRVQGFGQRFGALSASAATLGGTVINLSRQYQDLGDSQIRVDRVTLKLNKSQEALTKAQDKLAGLQAKGIRSGKEYEQAQLDVAQAEEQVKIQTDLLREAQEDHQRAQEDFWFSLGPTIGSAVTTAISSIQSFMGDKGLGGMKKAVEGVTASIGIGGAGGKGGKGLLGALGSIGKTAGPLLAGAGGGILLTELAATKQADIDKQLGIKNRVSPLQASQSPQTGAKYMADLTKETEAYNKAGVTMLDILSDMLTGTTLVNDKLAKQTQTVSTLGTGYNTLATSSNALANQIVRLRTDYDQGRITADQYNTTLGKLRQTHLDTYDAANREATQILALSGNYIPLNQQTEQAATNTTKLGQATATSGKGFQGMAANIKFLDSNLQPLPPLMQQMGEALGQANANLGTSVDIGGEYVKQVDAQIKAENDRQVALFNTAQQLGIKGAYEDDEVSILELLIQQQRAAIAGDYDRVRSLGELIKKYRDAAKAAATYTNLVPYSSSLKGPRNPNFRVRKDYVAPIVHGKPSHKIKFKPAQTGMNELLREDTMIMAHASERVRITPPGASGGGGGWGGKMELVLSDGTRLDAYIRRVANDGQGTYK